MITPNQLHILRHSLGLDDQGRGKEYRNHYCADVGHRGWDDLMILCQLGLMEDHGVVPMWGGSHGLSVTDKGRSEAIRGVKPVVLSRSKRRYRNFRAMCEVCPDLTFREFLTDYRYDQWRDREAS